MGNLFFYYFSAIILTFYDAMHSYSILYCEVFTFIHYI